MKKKYQKQIWISFFLIAIVCLVLGISLNVFSENAIRVQRQEAMSKIEATSQTARTMVENQISSNFQTMLTLASLLGNEMSETDPSRLPQLMSALSTISEQNSFVRMGFIDANGIEFLSYIDGRTESNVDMSDDPYVQKALQGEEIFSYTLWDDSLKNYVNRYFMPVYQGGIPQDANGNPNPVIGVLCGTHYTDTLRHVLSATLFDDVGFSHIITDTGNFVVRNITYFMTDARNIFDSPTIDGQSETVLLEAFSQRNAAFVEVEANGSVYDLYFRPISYNNWYIMTVVPQDLLISDISQWLMLQRTSFYALFFLFLLLAFYIYYTMQQNTRTMYRLAYVDPVTGCWNRHRFLNELPVRLSSTPKALVMMEVDSAELIKNLYGLNTFNRLQQHIASCLRQLLQSREIYCMGQHDRFVFLLNAETEDDVRQRVEAILTAARSFQVNTHQNFQLIFSCGVRFVTKKDDNLETMITQAALTLESAKRLRQDEILFFRPNIYEPLLINNRIESIMEKALEDEEFHVWLQSKIDLKTGKLSSCEALVRWIRPDGSMIYPGQFVPLFERNGFCVNLDYYMMEHVCRQLRTWIDEKRPVVPVSVNQCRLMFYESNYIQRLNNILEQYQIPKNLIVLEVTESLAMDNPEQMYAILHQLRDQGFCLSMDDFGSGFSSLNSLKDLPIHELKLDRVFLSAAEGSDLQKRDLVMKSIIQMAHSLHMKTVIEGVETEEQAQLMRELDCDVAQGYFYSKPIPCGEFCEKYFVPHF